LRGCCCGGAAATQVATSRIATTAATHGPIALDPAAAGAAGA